MIFKNTDCSLVTELGLAYDTENTIIYNFNFILNAGSEYARASQTWLHRTMMPMLRNPARKKIILDSSTEAPSADIINSVLGDMKNVLFIDGSSYSTSYRHVAWPKFFGYRLPIIHRASCDYLSRWTYFVCMNRVPRYTRVEFVNMLLVSGLIEKGSVSLGSDVTVSQGLPWIDFIHTDFRLLMPLRIDDYAGDQQYIVSPVMQQAIINVVTETAFERQTFVIADTDLTRSAGAMPGPAEWNRIFVTEKTVKAFLMKQLPLFVTVRGHVQYLRDTGLDLFDDFLNNSYDLVVDPDERIRAVFNELQRLCNMPIEVLQQFCHKNAHRFEHNALRISSIATEETEKIKNTVQNFINN